MGIDIKNGVLITDHYGGSSWKWSYTEKYRFQQNNFYLIGYTEEYGKYGFEWKTFDFNLSTGKILFTKSYNDEVIDTDLTEDYAREITETFYKKNVKITLKNRNHYKLKIVSPKYKETLSL